MLVGVIRKAVLFLAVLGIDNLGVAQFDFDDDDGNGGSYQVIQQVNDLAQQHPQEGLQILGNNLLGEMIDPNTGSIEFEHVDVTLPGNSGLEVAIRRRRGRGFCL